MAASRRVSPAAARPSAPGAPRARGRRRRPSLWRRVLLALPRPAQRASVDPIAALQDEVHELRLAVAALRAEIADLHARPPVQVVMAAELAAAIEPAAVTLVLPLARAAQAAGIPADGVVALDLGPDTAETEIVLTPAPAAASLPAEPALPEAPLLDPRLARVAEALDDLLDDGELASAPSPSPGDHAGVGVREAG